MESGLAEAGWMWVGVAGDCGIARVGRAVPAFFLAVGSTFDVQRKAGTARPTASFVRDGLLLTPLALRAILTETTSVGE